jgi:hypothetical protein
MGIWVVKVTKKLATVGGERVGGGVGVVEVVEVMRMTPLL